MKTKPFRSVVAVVTAAAFLATQVTIADELTPAPPPPKQDTLLALCVVACLVAAGTAIYIISKKCQPKYYCLMDDDSPPHYWAGTATAKECQINNWKKCGGPYNSAADVVNCPPAPGSNTNVAHVASAPMRMQVHQSRDLVNWTKVYEEVCDPDDFGYAVTNSTSGSMFFMVSEAIP